MSYHRGGINRGDGADRKKILVVGGIIMGVILIWILFVLSFGGGTGPGQEAQGAAGDGAAQQGEQQDNPQQGGEGPAGNGNDGPVRQGGGGEPESLEAEDPERAQREKYDQTPDGGVTDEPAGHDPLGIEPEEGQLAARDQGRAELAAGNFITAAYGYTGDDRNEYNQKVGQTVVWPDFYDSEGSSEIQDYASQVEDSGTESAARLDRFEVETNEGEYGEETLTGYAYFATADAYGRYGDIQGNRMEYRQELTLVRTDATFKVKAVQPIEET